MLVPSAVTLALAGESVDREASAAPPTPIAVKVTGAALRPVAVALRPLAPALVPSVQLPTAAMPKASVVAEAPLTNPPPETTSKVTRTPDTGLLPESVTSTLGAMATAVPTAADWPLPPLTCSPSPLSCAVDAWTVVELLVVNEADEKAAEKAPAAAATPRMARATRIRRRRIMAYSVPAGAEVFWIAEPAAS